MKQTSLFKSFLIALLIGLGGAYAGAYSTMLLVPAAAGTVYLGLRHGKAHAACAALFTLLGIFFSYIGNDLMMYTLWTAYSFFVIFSIVAFTVKLPHRLTAFVLAAAALISLYICIGLPSLRASKPPYDGIVEALRAIEEYGRSTGYVIDGIANLRESVSTSFYGMLILGAEALSFFTVILSYRFLSASRVRIRPMARFREWQLPQSLKLGIPIFAALIAALYAMDWGGASVLLVTLLSMLLPLFTAAGIATAVYIGSRGRSTISFPIILFIGFAVVMSPYFMALLGVIDLYADIRRKLIRADRLIREAFEKANREKSSTVTVDFGDGNGPQIIAVRKHDSAFFNQVLDGSNESDNDESAEADGDEADSQNAQTAEGDLGSEVENTNKTSEKSTDTDEQDGGNNK